MILVACVALSVCYGAPQAQDRIFSGLTDFLFGTGGGADAGAGDQQAVAQQGPLDLLSQQIIQQTPLNLLNRPLLNPNRLPLNPLAPPMRPHKRPYYKTTTYRPQPIHIEVNIPAMQNYKPSTPAAYVPPIPTMEYSTPAPYTTTTPYY